MMRNAVVHGIESPEVRREKEKPAAGRITIRLHREGSEMVIDVADDGPGISIDDAERVFEPFYTTKTEGTGVGLPMAERIARAHEGSLSCVVGEGAGPNGTGACFRLALPLSKAQRLTEDAA